MKQHARKDIFIIGFALFSMFFGAGNVIFPPYLGMTTGPQWLLGFICYYLADIGLALVALFSMFRRGGSEKIVLPIGRIPATILMCAIVLCIGPMLAIPRTAAMTFEMSVQPLVQGMSSIVFSVLFFVIVFLCSVRENSVVDIVGKILTPLLLVGLLILIVKGVVTPIGEIAAVAQTDNTAASGVTAGYQTMDVLATMLFGALIMRSVEAKGYYHEKEKRSIASKAGIVASVLLLVVYGGLTYLGATVSGMFDQSTGRSALMIAIVRGLLGQRGTVLFSVIVALACVTTAVGLVSSCSDYFCNLSHGRFRYQTLVIITCIFSAFVSNVGLEQLVSIASPVLSIVYPPALVLIGMSYLPELPRLTYRLATVGALLISLITVLAPYLHIELHYLAMLPFSDLGLGWLLPAIVCGVIGYLLSGKKSGRKPEETM